MVEQSRKLIQQLLNTPPVAPYGGNFCITFNEVRMKQTMKIGVLLLGALTVAMWFGMSSSNKKKEVLTKEVDRLEKRALQKELIFEEMAGMIDDVETQIDEIVARENLIVDQRGEQFSQDQKSQVIAELQMIDELILRSAQDIQTLNSKVRSTDIRLGVFQKQINGLQADLKSKTKEIVGLKMDLAKKDESIALMMQEKDSLNRQLNAYVETLGNREFEIDQLQALNKELNKGYLVIGTYDELKEKGVVDKEGGFLGLMGRRIALQEDVSLTQFMAVDKRDVNRLRIQANRLALVSEHPSDSYAILPGDSEEEKILEITNPDTFWQISQYLVISKKT